MGYIYIYTYGFSDSRHLATFVIGSFTLMYELSRLKSWLKTRFFPDFDDGKPAQDNSVDVLLNIKV